MIGAPGLIQADRRVLHMDGLDGRTVALHLASGERWQIQADVPWLIVPTSGFGSDSLTIRTFANLEPGSYTGSLHISSVWGGTERIDVTVHVSDTLAIDKVYLPLIVR